MLKLLLNSMHVTNCLLIDEYGKRQGYNCDERKRDGEKEKQRASRKEN